MVTATPVVLPPLEGAAGRGGYVSPSPLPSPIKGEGFNAVALGFSLADKGDPEGSRYASGCEGIISFISSTEIHG